MSWQKLVCEEEQARFAEIMRLMDERYSALRFDQFQHWLQCKQEAGKHPELFGWFDGDPTDLTNIRQVMAVTSDQDDDGHRSGLGISMLGIAADVIPETEWNLQNVETWLSRFLLCVKQLIGLDATIRAIRPKTMTWKAAEQIHDLMKTGIVFDSDVAAEGRLHAGVYQERDIGDSLYWKMRITRLDQRPPSESAATGVLCESLSVQR